MENFIHKPAAEFKTLPEIYQIEASSHCNLRCPMCLRTTEMSRTNRLFDVDLLKEMHRRGDFSGTSFVELQMAGEPTLHPKLEEIVYHLKDTVGVLVGLSTHGLNMSKTIGDIPVADVLLRLDTVTISVDSTNPEVYAQLRRPARFVDLLANLRIFFSAYKRQSFYSRCPLVELQLIETDLVEGSGDVQELQNLIDLNDWPATIRTTQDCFYEMDGRKVQGSQKRNSDLCLNPWSSVSVTADGDVVSCCYIFEPDKNGPNWYGSLKTHSLAEIWNSDRVQTMRQQQKTGQLQGQCQTCYLKSPTLIHQNILSRLVRLRGR